MWEVRGTAYGVTLVFLVWMTEWIKNAFTKMGSGEEKAGWDQDERSCVLEMLRHLSSDV